MITFLKEHSLLVKIVFSSFLVLLLVGAIIIASKLEKTKGRSNKIKKYATIAIFSGVSVALYYLRFPFPIFDFLKIQFSIIPAYIIGFLLGPASGLMVIFIRTAICIPFTHSLCVGEIADLLIGIATILTSSVIYMRDKTKKQAAISLIYGSVAWILIAIVANYLLLVPLYIQLYFNADTNAFIGTLSAGIPSINEDNYMLLYTLLGVIPFNFLMTALSSVITFIIYKHISMLYKNIAKDENKNKIEEVKEEPLN